MSRWSKVNAAKAKRANPNGVNKTEAAYAQTLKVMLSRGEIRAYQFEPFTLRLGHRCSYTPDFLVVTDLIELHEVKGTRGFQLDPKGRVKLYAAAQLHPWIEFYQAMQRTKKDGGGFVVDVVKVNPGAEL